MKKIPLDFKVTDSHRLYCEQKWNSPNLADQFLEDFVELFTENEKKHKDWNRTFQNYIRNNSPSGRFYNSRYWELKLSAAKVTRKRDIAKYSPVYIPDKPAEKQVVDAAMTKLRSLLA